MVAVLLGLAATSVAAQGFRINKTDGTKIYLKSSQVDSIGVYADPSVKTFTVTGNGKTVMFHMKLVEAGTFRMGNNSGDASHLVTLTKDYYMGEAEVTQALWYAVMGKTPTDDGSQWSTAIGMGDSYPAYFVNWNDCHEFITKLNQLTGQTFHLPTEAEWEFAALGGNKSHDYTYAGSNTLDDVAWYRSNSDLKCREVRGKAANELGLYDMSGNVVEWCQDWYGSYSRDNQTDPTGPTTGIAFVYRGGCWYNEDSNCGVTLRNWYLASKRYADLGFRIAIYSSDIKK